MKKRKKITDAHMTRVIKVPARVKPIVQVKATAHKKTFSRTNLPDGDFLMNFYYIKDECGRLVPEDIESATHFERVVYDRDGNVIGSTIGRLTRDIRW